MAATKRSKEQREHDLSKISEMLLQGFSQQQIANAIGGLSRQMISYDIQQIRRQWQERSIEQCGEAISRQLDELRLIKCSAWADYSLSRVREQVDTETGEVVQKQKPGDPRYLDLVLKGMEREAKLLGLDMPDKVELSRSKEEQQLQINRVQAFIREKILQELSSQGVDVSCLNAMPVEDTQKLPTN